MKKWAITVAHKNYIKLYSKCEGRYVYLCSKRNDHIVCIDDEEEI